MLEPLEELWGHYLELKWSDEGNYFYYLLNDCVTSEEGGDLYDFVFGKTSFNGLIPKTAIEISLLAAIAQIGGVGKIMDTQSLIASGDEYGYVTIEEVMALKVGGYSDVFEAAKAFYQKLRWGFRYE